MFEPKEMAVRIKNAAKVNKIKLCDMWRDLKLSNNTLHNMNNGSMPSIGTLMRIAQYVGVPSDYILGEKIEKVPSTKAGDDYEPIPVKMTESAWRELFSKMPIEDIAEILDYARYLRWKRNQVL